MAKLDPEDERNAVDHITNCMYSVAFLTDISDVIFSANRDKATVGQFYDNWLKASGTSEAVVPFSLGILLAYMYVGILFAKENWFDLIPDADLATEAATQWGLKGMTAVVPREPDPTVRYVVRRIRNSLGHGSPVINVPSDGVSRQNILSAVTVRFKDVNQRDAGDTFEADLNLKSIMALIKKFQGEVHRHVRTKYGIDPPRGQMIGG